MSTIQKGILTPSAEYDFQLPFLGEDQVMHAISESMHHSIALQTTKALTAKLVNEIAPSSWHAFH